MLPKRSLLLSNRSIALHLATSLTYDRKRNEENLRQENDTKQTYSYTLFCLRFFS